MGLIITSYILKTKRNLKTKQHKQLKRQYITIAVFLLLLLLLSWFKQSPDIVERYYSRGFYPVFSYFPKLLVGWLPFSFGDLFYAILVFLLVLPLVLMLIKLFKKQWIQAWSCFLRFTIVCLIAYSYFYISWGLNYYRIPLEQQLQLRTDSLSQDDYLEVLERYIAKTNQLRSQLDSTVLDRKKTQSDLEELMRHNSALLPMLARTQVHAKNPLSSELASYFTVTGYLNPFTQEVQVNAIAPVTSYPFTVVHELSHQMGIGLEDECNFIAFLALHDHPNLRYQYSAYYETVEYLLRPLYFQDEPRYRAYVNKLSSEVRQDYVNDRLFWKRYRSSFERLMSIFYGNYLKHNNQPEGVARYSLMSRLVVAWDIKERETRKE